MPTTPTDADRLAWIRALLGADDAVEVGTIQSLWSGYGRLYRVRLAGAELPSVVVKAVAPPDEADHPRGWSSDRGHARKLRSYTVEAAFYRTRAARCGPTCRVPRLLGHREEPGGAAFVLEDLDAAITDRRGLDRPALNRRLSPPVPAPAVDSTLAWLAAFHATFLGEDPAGLWPVGTYWHLATRPDEHAAMLDPALQAAAGAIDARLSGARWQTLVHGDAKVANFCFGGARRHPQVAAVDFQYVGGGPGVKDLAYFLGGALPDDALAAEEPGLTDRYFTLLAEALAERGHDPAPVVAEWRALLPWAWADFERFLDGWAPGHWKRSPTSAEHTARVLDAVAAAS